MQSAATTIGEISQPVTGYIARGIAAAVAGSVAVVVAGAGIEARIGDSAARFARLHFVKTRSRFE
jgi:hypothetical protein